MVWDKGGTTTLTSGGDSISVATLPNTKFITYMAHGLATGGSIELRPRFNSDSGTNYARRLRADGGTEYATGSIDTADFVPEGVYDSFIVIYVINISSEEKLLTGFGVGYTTLGAGTAPTRTEGGGKWSNTSDPIDEIQAENNGTGNYDTDSNLSVLGTN